MNECGKCEFFGCDLCVQICFAWRCIPRELSGRNGRYIGVCCPVTGGNWSLEERNPARNSLEPSEIGRHVCESCHRGIQASCIEVDIERASVACFRDVEDVCRRCVRESEIGRALGGDQGELF